MGNDISSVESASQHQEKVKSTNNAILKLASIVLGSVFGFLLVSIGATTFDIQAKMFLFQDFQLPFHTLSWHRRQVPYILCLRFWTEDLSEHPFFLF